MLFGVPFEAKIKVLVFCIAMLTVVLFIEKAKKGRDKEVKR